MLWSLRLAHLPNRPALEPHQAGISVDDVDIYEINEAFASQALYCIETLKIPMAKARKRGRGGRERGRLASGPVHLGQAKHAREAPCASTILGRLRT